MRIAILTYGSRGDVQPFLALGQGLQRAGYRVRLAAPEGFAGLVGEAGLDFTPLPGDPAALSREMVDRAGSNPLRLTRAMSAFVLPLALEVLAALRDACADADAVVHTFLMTNAGHEIALERGIPEFSAQMFPVFAPTAAFPAPTLPALPLGGWYNRLTHRFTEGTFWHGGRLMYGWLRRTHRELPPLHGWPFAASPPVPLLFGFSPLVIPPAPDWGDHVHVTGYWIANEPHDWQPPDDLARFLEAGPPPVYIGFGSVVTRDAARLTQAALDALALSGQRGILLGGWSGLGGDQLPPHVLKIESAPHGWLFPRMAAVIHHGGAGTTAAGLRSGVPSIITPFTADQPFWGDRVYRLGVGPQPIPRSKLTAARLADAIRQAVADAMMRARAAEVGAAIRAEDGVRRAVEIVESYLGSTKSLAS